MRTPINRITYEINTMIGNCLYLGDSEIRSKKWVRNGIFLCECGKQFIASIQRVKSKHTRSCGCLVTKTVVAMNGRHFRTYTPEFRTWNGMKQRCNNPNNTRYYMWGARGIKVCDRWQERFENFLEDMGERPSDKHTLDRIDNNGDYCKENCRWATNSQQCMNRRSNFMVTYKGLTKPLKMWTDELNLVYSTTMQRIKKLKWTTERAFEYKKIA